MIVADDKATAAVTNRSRRPALLGYLMLSIAMGAAFWGLVFLLPLLHLGANPIGVASDIVGYGSRIDHPLIVERSSSISLIEPAAGPAVEN